MADYVAIVKKCEGDIVYTRRREYEYDSEWQ